MIYRLFSFINIAIGLTLALLFIKGSPSAQNNEIFTTVTSSIFQAMAFLTTILLLTSLCIAINQLIRKNQLAKVLRYFFTTTIIIYLVTQFLAFVVSKISFLPDNQIPDISQLRTSLSIFGLKAEIWDNMKNIQSISWLSTLYSLSPIKYIIWFFFTGAFAFVMITDMEAAGPSYNLIDSISRLFFRLLQNIFSFLNIYLIIYIIYTIWYLRSNDLLIFYMGFFTKLITITILLFAVAPLFLFFVYKDKRAYLFLWESFLSILTGFLTGNNLFSISVLTVEQKIHFSMPRNTTGLLNPLNILFLRPGSAILLSYSFITYYYSNTRWQLGIISEITWVFIIPVILAVIMGLLSIPNYFIILPFYFLLFGIETTNNFIIITPILLLGQNFASGIDLLSWNLSNYVYNKFYDDSSHV